MPLVGDSMASCSVTKYDEPAVYFMPWGNSKKKNCLQVEGPFVCQQFPGWTFQWKGKIYKKTNIFSEGFPDKSSRKSYGIITIVQKLVEIIEFQLQVVSEISTSRLSCAISKKKNYQKALVRTNSIIPL
jgi:hypothetical protein